MFFYLSKILSFLLTPLAWVLVLLLLALVFKRRKISGRLLLIAFIALYLFSNPFIADEMIRLWETPSVHNSDLANQYDIGIVLGGGMITVDKESNTLTFRDNVDRIMQALSLYKNGRINKILISGGSGSLIYRNMKESQLLKEYLVDIGIPANNIIIETESDNTYENARNTSEILKNEYPGSTCLLITSAIHMRRARACFNKSDVIVSIYPTNTITAKRRYQFSHLFVPDVDSFKKWDLFLHELVGYLVYKIMGYA